MDYPILVAIYVIVNITAAMMYVIDKKKAIKDEWRIPEATLLFLALLGPFGATAAMLIAHHKTRKPKFKLVYVFLAIHIVIILALLVYPL